MVTIEEALRIVKSQEIALKTQTNSLSEALGFTLSRKVLAPFDMPSFDNSAMDGYALCGLQKEYTLVGEIAAGDTADLVLKDGEAARIFTGAKVPENTTAVMMQEKTNIENTTLFLDEMPRESQNIRKRGGELAEGQIVFKVGHVINAATLGLLGSLGLENIEVFQKPTVKLITTGNELITPGQPKEEGQIYESNSFALSGALEQFGFRCSEKIQIKDDYEATKSGIAAALDSCDVLLLSGGISVGDYDFVKQALEENGVEEQFYKVMQKPGKPLFFGRKADKFIFALPGNPASSLTCFYVYVLPLLQKISGAEKYGLTRYYFPLNHDYENKGNRPVFLKAKYTDGKIEILDGQGSSMIQSMALGNALAFVNAETVVKKGEPIECLQIN